MEVVKKTMGENFTKASELYNFVEKRIPFQECVQMIGKLARGGVNLNGRGFQVWMRAVNRRISGVMNGSVDVCGEDTLDALRKMEVRHERQNELRIAELVTDFQEGIDKMNGEKDGWKSRIDALFATVEKEAPMVRPEKKPVEFAERMADLQAWMQAALAYMLYEQDTDEKMDFVTRMVRKMLREIREIRETVSTMGAA